MPTLVWGSVPPLSRRTVVVQVPSGKINSSAIRSMLNAFGMPSMVGNQLASQAALVEGVIGFFNSGWFFFNSGCLLGHR